MSATAPGRAPGARPQIWAHRGASRVAPENTVAAFAAAVAMGADGVELDVRPSADGALVVHHDAHLADGRAVAALRRTELGSQVCTLDEALDACGRLVVNVEIKHAPDEPGFHTDRRLADAVVDVLARRDPATYPSSYVVSSFDPHIIKRVRARRPELATAWLVDGVADVDPARLAAGGHRFLNPEHPLVDPGLVVRCHAVGLGVVPWTVDEPERMRALAAAGVDALITNVPDVARAALGRDGVSDR